MTSLIHNKHAEAAHHMAQCLHHTAPNTTHKPEAHQVDQAQWHCLHLAHHTLGGPTNNRHQQLHHCADCACNMARHCHHTGHHLASPFTQGMHTCQALTLLALDMACWYIVSQAGQQMEHVSLACCPPSACLFAGMAAVPQCAPISSSTLSKVFLWLHSMACGLCGCVVPGAGVCDCSTAHTVLGLEA